MKIDPSVKKETCRVAVGNSCLACMMLLVYMLIGRMNWRVTAGAALGVFSSVLNFSSPLKLTFGNLFLTSRLIKMFLTK